MGNEPLRVVGYVRGSTEDQTLTIEAQTAKVRAYCALYGLDLVCVLSDLGASGKSLDREGLGEALGMLRDGRAQGLVVAKLDRLTRSVVDLGRLIEEWFSDEGGKQLLSVADSIDTRTAAGRLTLNVLASVTQWEREVIVERTKDALAHKRSKGERIGSVPYGFILDDDGKTLLKDENEQQWIAWMRLKRTLGAPVRAIARWLDELGVRPKNGGESWSPSTVGAILRRGDGTCQA